MCPWAAILPPPHWPISVPAAGFLISVWEVLMVCLGGGSKAWRGPGLSLALEGLPEDPLGETPGQRPWTCQSWLMTQAGHSPLCLALVSEVGTPVALTSSGIMRKKRPEYSAQPRAGHITIWPISVWIKSIQESVLPVSPLFHGVVNSVLGDIPWFVGDRSQLYLPLSSWRTRCGGCFCICSLLDP